jgi:flagellar protein FliO/FliZ
MFETLFGSEMPLAARFFIAFLVVLGLIGLTAWLVRRFGASRLGGGAARGRQPRLAVIDAATVDGRRRLVLIRRDNVEHLLMIGGPTDVVVEPNIVRAAGSREITREPGRIEVTAREETWPLQPGGASTPVPAPRPYRSADTEDTWHAPEPAARFAPEPSARHVPEPAARPRSADSLAGLAAELSTRFNPPDLGTPPARNEPVTRASPAPVVHSEPAPSPQNDHNLAEMAQQLEAALRRSPVAEGRPPVTDPLAAQAANNPPPKPEAPARAPMREFKSRVEPNFESKFGSRPEPRAEPRLEPAAPPGKNQDNNLEEEMASLLGRPSGKT